MYTKDLIRVHTHTDRDGYYATVTYGGDRVYVSGLFLDDDSMAGWLKDFRAALRDVRCTWCAEPASFVTEIDGLDIFGFCSTDCQADALNEAAAMSLTDDGGF